MSSSKKLFSLRQKKVLINIYLFVQILFQFFTKWSETKFGFDSDGSQTVS